MLRNLTENSEQNLPATTRGYSIVKFARLDADAFSEFKPKFACAYTWLLMVNFTRLGDANFFELQASPVYNQSLQQRDKKRRKRKGTKKINTDEKPKDLAYFLEILIFAHVRERIIKASNTLANRRLVFE